MGEGMRDEGARQGRGVAKIQSQGAERGLGWYGERWGLAWGGMDRLQLRPRQKTTSGKSLLLCSSAAEESGTWRGRGDQRRETRVEI
jgi:hypothetical protein